MWTTKRLLLLLAGFTLFFSLYLVYAHFLGGIDGLPPLPGAFTPSESSSAGSGPMRRHINLVDHKLQMAFGPGSEELRQCTIKLEVDSKNLVLASNDYEVLKDGRVKLWPFNLALFGKDKGDSRYPEINTVQSKIAYLTFDRPVKNITEMGNRKIVAGELEGDIKVYNNRRSAQRDDDLSLTTPGPLFYDERKREIWTDASVDLVDTQRKPEPTSVTAVGMRLELSPEDGKDAEKRKGKVVNGIDRIHLNSTVAMHMWVDGESGFLDSSTKPKEGEADAKKEPAKVVINTQGPFLYNVLEDEAVFEIPPRPSRLGERVKVTKLTGVGGRERHDRLECDRLHLTLKRKSQDEKQPEQGDNRGDVNLMITSAHATGRQVTLASDAEGLHAIGVDFFHDAVKHESVLTGGPELVALKDGHEIYARELRLTNAGDKTKQQAFVKGPGRIAMLDRATTKRTMFATWKDNLVFTKEGEYEILILTESAVFEDRAHDQKLSADRLKVWLEPKDKTKTPGEESDNRTRPHKLEATGNVHASSAELIIGAPTEHLIVWFKDAPTTGTALPKTASTGSASTGGGAARAGSSAAAPAAAGNEIIAVPGTGRPSGKKPLEISARAIETFVLRHGARNDIEHVRCEGNVHVHQDPNPNEQRGVEIHGDTLRLDHAAEGSLLVVTGDLAQVQLNKINILGPEVNIDQRMNKAWVDGRGVMQILTNRDFDGRTLKEPTELTIHWNDKMLFNGQYAIFHGNIQAEQENARLLCKEMQAFLDHPVSFKEGEKAGQAAKIRELVCDKSVRIENTTRDEKNGKLLRYTRLTSPEVAMNNEDGKLNASGPGVVHFLQPGPANDDLPGSGAGQRPVRATDPVKREILKLTRVNYLGRLYADNQKRTATFYSSVEVVHAPTDNPDQVIDPDNPMPGAFFLSCELLKVFSHKHANGQATQEMEAHDRVFIESREFSGRCSVLKYDESKDLVILEGGDNGKAVLYRIKTPGAPHEKLTGKKILYWRKSNEVKIEGAQGLNVNPN